MLAGKTISGKHIMRFGIVMYIILTMVSSTTGSILTKVARIMLILAFTCRNISKFRFPIKAGKYLLWSVSFLLYAIIGCFFAYSKTYAYSYTASLAYVVICDMIILISTLQNSDIINSSLRAIISGATIKALVCYLTNGFFCFFTSRSTDTTSANTIGFYCAFAAIICWVLFRENRKKGYTVLLAANLCFLLLSASRKAILFLVIPLVVMSIAKSKNSLYVLRNILASIAGVAIIVFLLIKVDFLYTLIGRRFVSAIYGVLGKAEADGSTSTRLSLIADGMTWFAAKPIWGYGISNFKALCSIYRPWGTIYYAHNNYVELLVDCGLVGTALYYLMPLSLLVRGCAARKRLNYQQIMFWGMLVAILICDYVMVSYFDVFSQLMLVLIYCSLQKKKDKGNEFPYKVVQ